MHPSRSTRLWRQSVLVAQHGLYEVVEGIYQVRGLDLSNVTFVEGDAGVLVIDPLISTETAAAALALYREHRGDRPVTGVVYTHSHVDHFGGVKGVALERGPQGQVGAGLGQTTSTGTVTLIAPTVDITTTGQEEVVDGVRIVFLSLQRDLYAYLHDWTVRMLNKGMVGPEIAEEIVLPPLLPWRTPGTRGYYGSVSHNVKGGLPAVPGVVRRQPRPPLGPPAGRGVLSPAW